MKGLSSVLHYRAFHKVLTQCLVHHKKLKFYCGYYYECLVSKLAVAATSSCYTECKCMNSQKMEGLTKEKNTFSKTTSGSSI